ncbi:unnamed protein product [Brassica oleracea var. botrytis]
MDSAVERKKTLWTDVNCQQKAGTLKRQFINYGPSYNARTDVLNTRINEPHGLVTAMTFTNGMPFVGTSCGRISLWKDEDGLYTYNPQPFTYLRTFSDSHTEEISCLPSVGDNLFFGSRDNRIKVRSSCKD